MTSNAESMFLISYKGIPILLKKSTCIYYKLLPCKNIMLNRIYAFLTYNQASDNLDQNKRFIHGRSYFNSFISLFLLNCFHFLTSQLIICYESTYNMFTFASQNCTFSVLFSSRLLIRNIIYIFIPFYSTNFFFIYKNFFFKK